MSARFEQVPLVGTGAGPEDDVEAWLASPPVHALVGAFADGPDDRDLLESLTAAKGETRDRLAALDAFTDRWDTRRGLERNQAKELPLTPEQEELVPAAATALGLRGGARLRFRRYDHALILGGIIRACLARPAYAAHLIRTNQIEAGSITALGGHRPFAGDEFQLASAAEAPELNEEYEALDFGTRRAFDLTEPVRVEGEESDLPGGTWGIRHYRTHTGIQVRVVAAPSSEPGVRRANTSDSYDFFAHRLAGLRPGQRLLVITTPIYVPAQHATAVRTLALPFRVEVDTVGSEPGAAPNTSSSIFSATKYLLEIRSTVRAMRQLIDAL
ncbi:hypothetical protein SRB5_13440 [Streptomyces sp. RB5]|uniref:Uncharacterized protein n=1 Tax=Streptomyces smaragdinus TaxID=2585196 RepID=A0A7K0CCQ3_9ACTN|nr:hypothetical protein [Streptomyces smaragdinus]MQY11229.1 hypothetical protein [Streptomyces smaragdinus]